MSRQFEIICLIKGKTRLKKKKETKNVFIFSATKIILIGMIITMTRRFPMKIASVRSIWISCMDRRMKFSRKKGIRGCIWTFAAVIWMNRSSC